jgi:hypothetical protein
VDLKQTFLDQALTSAVIASHGWNAETDADTGRAARLPSKARQGRQAGEAPQTLLLARYIPRPTGERLAAAGVNFVDRVGNMHLALGDDHHVLMLGRREPAREVTSRRPGPALVQIYFILLAEPASLTWPVRRLADEAGVGKTAAATALQRLLKLGVLAQKGTDGYHVVERQRLIDAFLQGYVNVLRPHLEIGRFRAAERDGDKFLRQFAEAAVTTASTSVAWAATGAPAAYALDRFYRAETVPLFVADLPPAMPRALRLVPDRDGPITLLRPFGQHWMWKTIAKVPIAHPWLVYAELLYRDEPRALEAASHIREQFLAA